MDLKNKAISIKNKLSHLARQNNCSYQYIATSFLLERLVVRLISDEDLSKSLVFKGGYVGLRIYKSPRYTIDLDALLIKSHIQKTMKQIKIAVEKDIGDGVWFRFEKTIDLQTQGFYGGTRYVLRTGIGIMPKNLNKMWIFLQYITKNF